jgi:sporulation protein YlmC with PRC-barrel domain
MTLTQKLSVLPFVVGLAIGGSAMAATTTDDTTHETAKATTHMMLLTGVTNPKDTLTKAKVEDTKGASVGTVDEVMFDKKGKPSSLKVDVGSFLGVGGKDVAMKASAFKFDSDRKVLVTSMTKTQIKKLPEVKS